MKITILLILISFAALADDQGKSVAGFDPRTDVIADNYDAGAYLIYDCKEKHWTCVVEENFKECGEKRTRDLASAEVVTHSCAPIGLFPTKRSCFQRQLFMVTHNHGARFCLKDNWKEKAVDY
jgi:hypothetical protein